MQLNAALIENEKLKRKIIEMETLQGFLVSVAKDPKPDATKNLGLIDAEDVGR